MIKQYLDKTKEILKSLNRYSMEHVRQDHNKKADALSKLALMTFSQLAKEVLVEVLPEKPIVQKEVANIIKEEVVLKIMKLGYYWPSMHIDAKAQIQRCEACQIHSPVPRNPKQEMTSIILAWPFSWWGIDIVGPLLMALGGARFLVVAIDYFTKWVEAKPLVSIIGKHMEKFVWEHIVCRFGYILILYLSLPSSSKWTSKGLPSGLLKDPESEARLRNDMICEKTRLSLRLVGNLASMRSCRLTISPEARLPADSELPCETESCFLELLEIALSLSS
ncbi:reverse transcriptase domain-containing protein [Tanacetum coccineum]